MQGGPELIIPYISELKRQKPEDHPFLQWLLLLEKTSKFFWRGRMILWSWKPDDLTSNPGVDTDFPV